MTRIKRPPAAGTLGKQPKTDMFCSLLNIKLDMRIIFFACFGLTPQNCALNIMLEAGLKNEKASGSTKKDFEEAIMKIYESGLKKGQ